MTRTAPHEAPTAHRSTNLACPWLAPEPMGSLWLAILLLAALALTTGCDKPVKTSGGTIAADIPGLVVEIKVTVGQQVKLGDPVVVVEAMKMQNELTAAVSGTVTAIPVNAGDPVNPGDPLVIIEPEVGG